MQSTQSNPRRLLRVIITGATGMVGEGVMHMCLQSAEVGEVLSLSRKPSGHTHPKLREVLHNDFMDISGVADQLKGYDACFFCLGVSSMGISKEAYFKNTYKLTMHVAETLSLRNPGMIFCYVSGAGTNIDSRLNWAQVKGKTEKDLLLLPFGKVYNYRPGFIKPVAGMKHTQKGYRYLGWLFPIGRAIYPGAFCKLEELGRSMIRVAGNGYGKTILEGKDIIESGRK